MLMHHRSDFDIRSIQTFVSERFIAITRQKNGSSTICRAMRYQRTATRHLKRRECRDSLNRVHRQRIYRWMFCMSPLVASRTIEKPREFKKLFLKTTVWELSGPFRSDCYYFHRTSLCAREEKWSGVIPRERGGEWEWNIMFL